MQLTASELWTGRCGRDPEKQNPHAWKSSLSFSRILTIILFLMPSLSTCSMDPIRCTFGFVCKLKKTMFKGDRQTRSIVYAFILGKKYKTLCNRSLLEDDSGHRKSYQQFLQFSRSLQNALLQFAVVEYLFCLCCRSITSLNMDFTVPKIHSL